MQKHVNLVDLVKSFPTNIYLQNLASIQKRTSPIKFAHLAEKSGNGSISNLSTKVAAVWYPQAGIKVLANANTWQQANATVEYQVGPEWRLQAGLSYDHADGSRAGVRLSFWPKKLSTWDNAYN